MANETNNPAEKPASREKGMALPLHVEVFANTCKEATAAPPERKDTASPQANHSRISPTVGLKYTL